MKNNSLDILKKLGSGFKTPKGYFNTVENDVYAKLSAEKFPEKVNFKTPENYFDSVENKVLQQLSENENDEKQNFEVPKDYFENIEDKVFDRLQKENNQQPKVINLQSRLKKVMIPVAIAASLLLIFVLNYSNSTQNYNINEVASTEIESWIDDELILFESYEIAEVFDDVTLEEELNSDDQELLDYINGTDIESILNN